MAGGTLTIPEHVTQLVTHWGSFHADEVFATALLVDLFPDAEIIRSRKPELIQPAAGRIVYDVGGTFDPTRRVFDHHQPGAPTREDGTPYSAFGLVWRQFGQSYLDKRLPPGIAPLAFENFDRQMVLPIDLLDNGIVPPSHLGDFQSLSLNALIADVMPTWLEDDGGGGERAAFDTAVAMAAAIMANRVRHIGAKLEAEALIGRSIEASGASKVLILETGMPWHGIMSNRACDHFRLVVHPRSDGDWMVSAIPLRKGDYETRLDLPAEWAGLEGAALEEKAGIAGAVFCHLKRFIAVARTRQAALAMAAKTIMLAEKG